MNFKVCSFVQKRNQIIWLLAAVFGLGGLKQAAAQPTIISTIPANGAANVSGSAAVVFTFSAAMDTAVTTATFLDSANPTTPLPTTPV
jgi:methionine-rich copper-binding protein CopC